MRCARPVPPAVWRCVADAECSPMAVQEGPYYTAVAKNGTPVLKAFNYTKEGKTGQLFRIQMGGFFLTIEADANGVQSLKNFKDLLVGPEPVSLTCEAGTIALTPGCMKMDGKPGVVWALTQAPTKASKVPIHLQTDDLQAGQGKKMSSASKVSLQELPEGGTFEAYLGRHQSKNIMKMDATKLFEEGADGKTLLKMAEGQENLLKLLKVADLQLSLGLSKKIPKEPKGATMNIFAQHDDINDGNKILLFASAPVAGPPPHILQKGVLPGRHCLKDLMDLPWEHELQKVMKELVKPLVDFAVYFDTCVAASKWKKKNVTRGIPGRLVDLVQCLTKLYKSLAKDKVDELLACVKICVNTGADGEWGSSGLVLDPKVKALMKGNDESDGDDSDDKKKKRASPSASPANSTHSSSAASGSSKAAKTHHHVDSDDEESDDEESELSD